MKLVGKRIQRTLIYRGGAVVLVLLVGLAYWMRQRSSRGELACVTAVEAIPGASVKLMGGLIDPAKTYELLVGYYQCNPVHRGDLVSYQFSSTAPPVVKVVRAVPGDHFKVVREEKSGTWHLEVNKELIMDGLGQPYFFGGQVKPTISLYEESRSNILGPGEVIVLSAVSPGMNDSGAFGVVSQSDLRGKLR